jgi:hypothetical protein
MMREGLTAKTPKAPRNRQDFYGLVDYRLSSIVYRLSSI